MTIRRTDPEKRTSNEWQDYLNEQDGSPKFFISDPDGWDRKNFQYSFYEELITLSEFSKRRLNSTTITIKD